MTPTLNIAALTQRTGVPSDTIRKWEQRYGVLSPTRTSGGQRRYSELDVARIEWLKARIHEGYRIGEAAALLGDSTPVPKTAGGLQRAFVDATHASDADALGRLVGHALALASLEDALTKVLAPALVEVGDQWAAGDLTVAQEHLASAAVRAALQKLLADARPSVRGTAVLACAPAEQHEIGLMMLAVLLRSDGWQVAYLGADTPLADAVELANGVGAGALCFSVSNPEHAGGVADELSSHELARTLSVTVGGRGTKQRDLRGTVARLRTLAA
ncbi:MAG: MerR family transcriptional regulator [Gaiellaceae bacterium]